MLTERRGSGVWVFAYGALLWEREYDCDEEQAGTVYGMARYGMARRYCLRDTCNRGTPGRPSLTLGLEPADDTCNGAVVQRRGGASGGGRVGVQLPDGVEARDGKGVL